MKQHDSTELERTIYPVKYCKGAEENLFPITTEWSKGAKLSNATINYITLKYPNEELVKFDRRINTTDGWVGGVAYKHLQRTVDMNEYHKEFGHPSEKTARNTADLFGIKFVGSFKPCEDCALAKTTQKNVKEISIKKAEHKGERLCLDIRSSKKIIIGGSLHWILVLLSV